MPITESLLAGCIFKAKSGKEFAVIFEDDGKADILYSNGFQRRDESRMRIVKECELVHDFGSISKAIDYIMAGSSKEDASIS